MFNTKSAQCKHGVARIFCSICNPFINHKNKQEYMKSLELDCLKKIRIVSEKENPYADVCTNRHLWSEGFRYGYRWAIKHPSDTAIAIQENQDKNGSSTINETLTDR